MQERNSSLEQENNSIISEMEEEKQRIKEEKDELIQMKQQFQQMITQTQMQNKLEQQRLDKQKQEQQKLERLKLEQRKSNIQKERSTEEFSEIFTNERKRTTPNQSPSMNNIRVDLEKLKKENSTLRTQISQMKDAKNLINQKFTELNKKNDMIKSNIEILNQRELEINLRENEVKELINNYRYLLNSRFYQMNVSSNENKSSYDYYFEPLDNVVSLKIVSCSLPIPRFNIDENNNKLYFTKNNESIEVVLKKGKYSIDRLIEIINFETKNHNLVFTLNENQKLNLSKIDITEDLITLKPTILSEKVLGFGDQDKYIDLDYSSIDAKETWDLRFHDKLLLYIKNINSDPISILYFNGKTDSTINFEKPIQLNNFEIEIKDINDNLYDFNNLKHSINIQLEITNQMFDQEPAEESYELDNISDVASQYENSMDNFQMNFN